LGVPPICFIGEAEEEDLGDEPPQAKRVPMDGTSAPFMDRKGGNLFKGS